MITATDQVTGDNNALTDGDVDDTVVNDDNDDHDHEMTDITTEVEETGLFVCLFVLCCFVLFCSIDI